MEIRIRETGAVMFEGAFRALFPNTSIPSPLTVEILNELSADPVLEGPQATTTTPYEFSYRDGVQEINGQWFTKYSVGPVFTDNEEATATEQEAAYKAQKDGEQAKQVRDSRNKKLTETDWTQCKDARPSRKPQRSSRRR